MDRADGNFCAQSTFVSYSVVVETQEKEYLTMILWGERSIIDPWHLQIGWADSQMGIRAWPGCSPNFGNNLRRGSHCSFSFVSSAIGTLMDQSLHAVFSTLKPCSPLSRRGKEEVEILKDKWEMTQILAEMAYPGTTDTRISLLWGVLFSKWALRLLCFNPPTPVSFLLHHPALSLLRNKVIAGLTLLQQHSLVSPSSLFS